MDLQCLTETWTTKVNSGLKLPCLTGIGITSALQCKDRGKSYLELEAIALCLPLPSESTRPHRLTHLFNLYIQFRFPLHRFLFSSFFTSLSTPSAASIRPLCGDVWVEGEGHQPVKFRWKLKGREPGWPNSKIKYRKLLELPKNVFKKCIQCELWPKFWNS